MWWVADAGGSSSTRSNGAATQSCNERIQAGACWEEHAKREERVLKRVICLLQRHANCGTIFLAFNYSTGRTRQPVYSSATLNLRSNACRSNGRLLVVSSSGGATLGLLVGHRMKQLQRPGGTSLQQKPRYTCNNGNCRFKTVNC